MLRDPWADPDPQPGDFDAELAAISPCEIEANIGTSNAKLTILVSAEDEDAEGRYRFEG
jgi:hypothetical protein